MLNGQSYVGDNNDDDDVDDNYNHVDDYDEVDANLEDGTWSAWRPMASISSYEQCVEDEVKYDHIIFPANCDFKHVVHCNSYQPG